MGRLDAWWGVGGARLGASVARGRHGAGCGAEPEEHGRAPEAGKGRSLAICSTCAASLALVLARLEAQRAWPALVLVSPLLAALAASTVAARPFEVMPGSFSAEASIDTVKLVSCCERLSRTISGRSSWRARSTVIGMQIRPQACEAKKVMCSGVTASAAMMRSPSFSRSSSSMRMTIRPCRMSSMMSRTSAIGTVRGSAWWRVEEDFEVFERAACGPAYFPQENEVGVAYGCQGASQNARFF